MPAVNQQLLAATAIFFLAESGVLNGAGATTSPPAQSNVQLSIDQTRCRTERVVAVGSRLLADITAQGVAMWPCGHVAVRVTQWRSVATVAMRVTQWRCGHGGQGGHVGLATWPRWPRSG